MNQTTPTFQPTPLQINRKTTGPEKSDDSDEKSSYQVLVFKTNILLPAMGIFVQPILDATEGIVQWTIDYDDCDHVLRVVTTCLDPRAIEEIILQTGFTCEELTD